MKCLCGFTAMFLAFVIGFGACHLCCEHDKKAVACCKCKDCKCCPACPGAKDCSKNVCKDKGCCCDK